MKNILILILSILALQGCMRAAAEFEIGTEKVMTQGRETLNVRTERDDADGSSAVSIVDKISESLKGTLQKVYKPAGARTAEDNQEDVDEAKRKLQNALDALQ